MFAMTGPSFRFLALLGALAASFVVAAPAARADVDERIVLRHFEDLYDSDRVSMRFCGRNVDTFLEELAANRALPSDMRRLVIRPPSRSFHPGYMMMALNARGGNATEGHSVQFWNFHVVAVWKGQVYDFSFDEKPRVVPIEQYFEEMFVPKEPFLIFGPGYRIRGTGPHFTPDMGADEVDSMSFEVERPRPGATNPVREAELEDFPKLLEWFGR